MMAMAVRIMIGLARIRRMLASTLSSISFITRLRPTSGVSDRVIIGRPFSSRMLWLISGREKMLGTQCTSTFSSSSRK